ncbi:TPM domain-containing protein [Thermoproteota archaeon]
MFTIKKPIACALFVFSCLLLSAGSPNYSLHAQTPPYKLSQTLPLPKHSVSDPSSQRLAQLDSTMPESASQRLPKPKGYILDQSGLLTAEEKAGLENLSYQIDNHSRIQVATAVLDSIGDNSIEDYSNRLFQYWGIGYKGSNKGVLFAIALKEKKVRIEVGYGLEGDINDAKAGDIIDTYVMPYFRKGEFKKGIILGHSALCKLIADAYQIPLTLTHSQTAPVQRNSLLPQLIFLIVFIMLMLTGKGRTLLLLLLLFGGGSRGGSGSFGGFGGSGFGGFGGFGGGLSGGGGASRGW